MSVGSNRVAARVWDPWREIAQLQREVGRLFGGSRGVPGLTAREYPPVNLYAGEQNLILTTEVPGVDPESIDVTVTGDTITLKAERKPEGPAAGDTFHRRERPSGTFTRTLQLPCAVDPGKTEARYEKGTLTVTLTRPEVSRPKKVNVVAAS
jgi:HSP20 family protein